jgi:HTH-type transcriptional regulator / antitoxin HigA
MAVKTAIQKLPGSYFRLVKQFPLTQIENDEHLEAAQQLIDQLLRENLDTGGQKYLDVLTDLVEIYEREHEAIPDASEAEVLRELMGSNRFTQSSLSKKVGISQSTISAVLNGARSLTKEQIITLGRKIADVRSLRRDSRNGRALGQHLQETAISRAVKCGAGIRNL